MAGVASLVPKVLPRQSPVDRAVMGIFSQWCRSVPERVYTVAQPVRLRAGVLSVHTRSAAWANLLQLETEGLLASLLSRYPACGARKIVFRVGPFPDLPLPRRETPPPEIVPLQHLPEHVAAQLARIQSDAVRDAVSTAIAVGLGERRTPE